MSVLECDRYGCPNVMCDRLSHGRQQYICYSCFEELVYLGPQTNLDEFMDSEPSSSIPEEASRAYFDAIFPLRDSLG